MCLQYELDIPIEVKVGTIGRISLSIPWTGLYTQSVTVTVEVRMVGYYEDFNTNQSHACGGATASNCDIWLHIYGLVDDAVSS
jgi:hypothetical protein